MNEFTKRLEEIESILNFYLPKNSSEEWQNLSFGNLDSCVNDSHFENLIKPCGNLVSLGGKRWRPLLLVLCAELAAKAKKNDERFIQNAYSLTPLVEFAHTASLIHDDIEDSAEERRGAPAAHIKYGIDVALNAASWLYFQATTCIKNLNLNEAEKNVFYEQFLQELRRLHLGQAMDIKWHREKNFVPSTDEYFSMVKNKTGTLARLAVKIGIFAGGGTAEDAGKCGKIAEDIGAGFQIIDDVTNLTTGNPGKKRGDDIVEGKKSLPVIIHLSNNPSDKEKLSGLFERAEKEGISSPAVEEAISILEGSGAIFEAKTKGDMIVLSSSIKLAEFYGANGSEEEKLIKLLFNTMLKK